MKRFLMLVGVGVVAAAMYVAASGATRQSVGPTAKQFAALKKQVASLSKELKTVKKEADAADGFLQTCIVSANSVVVPVSQFGDPAGTFGYEYTPDGTTQTDRTALDVDTQTPEALLLGVDPACVSNAAKHHLSSQRIGRLPHLSLRAQR